MESDSVKPKKKEDTKSGSLSKNHYTNNAVVRVQRNQAEKQRRDRLNDQIAQLASIVPTAVTATKPLDKVSILRLSASWMRLNYSCLNAKRFKSVVENYLKMHYSVVSNLNIIEKSINGFILATTFNGVILMCSRYVEDYIGYQNIDLLGNSIFNYILEKEKNLFEKKIRNLISKFKNGSSKNLRNIIRARMQQRPLPRSNEVKYRKMSFSFTIHSGSSAPSTFKPHKRNFKISKEKDFGENAVILIFVEPVHVEPDIDVMYLEEKDCYFTIHGPQGEIMYADHRISIVTGYMPRDVLGNSAYQYIHSSDVPIALFAQKAMFASSDGTGIITYRLRIHDANYIYLQTKGQIRYRDSSKEIRQFICCNLLLTEEDGLKELKKFQERFAPQLSASENVKHKIMKTKSLSLSPPTESAVVCKPKGSADLKYSTENILETLSEICNEYSEDTAFVDSVLSTNRSVNFQEQIIASENQTEKNLIELSVGTNQLNSFNCLLDHTRNTETRIENTLKKSPPSIIANNSGSLHNFNKINLPFENFIQSKILPSTSTDKFCTKYVDIQETDSDSGNNSSAVNLNSKIPTTGFLAQDIDLNACKHKLSNPAFTQQTSKRTKLGSIQNTTSEDYINPKSIESMLLQESFQLHQSSSSSIPINDQNEGENDSNFSFINEVMEKLISSNTTDYDANDPLSLPVMSMSMNSIENPIKESISKSLLDLPDDIDLRFLDQAASDNLLNDINGLDRSSTSLQPKISCNNSYAEVSGATENFPSSLVSQNVISQTAQSYPQSMLQNYSKPNHSNHLNHEEHFRDINSSLHVSLSLRGLKNIQNGCGIKSNQSFRGTNFASESYSDQSSEHILKNDVSPHLMNGTDTSSDALNVLYSHNNFDPLNADTQSNFTETISSVQDQYEVNSCFSIPGSSLYQVELDKYYDFNGFPLTNIERTQSLKKV